MKNVIAMFFRVCLTLGDAALGTEGWLKKTPMLEYVNGACLTHTPKENGFSK